MARTALFLFSCLMIGACSASSPEDGASDDALVGTRPSSDEANACEEGKVAKDANGDYVLRCEKPFAESPMIRLPDDTDGSTKRFYGGATLPLTGDGTFVLWARDGSRYVPVDTHDKPIDFASGGLPRGMHAPTNRATFTIYQFTGEVGGEVDSEYGRAKKIRLTAARPVVEIDGCAFDSRLAGVWEGDVSERLTTSTGGPFGKSFDIDKRVPIRVTLDKIKSSRKLADYKGGESLSDQETFILEGTIDNFEHEVVDGDKKFPSLSGMGKKNPFYGAHDGKISVYRLGNMHGLQNDGHWVFTYPEGSSDLTTNGMTGPLTAFTAPTFLFEQRVDADALNTIDARPHIPRISNGHRVVLKPRDIGAKMGQCPR